MQTILQHLPREQALEALFWAVTGLYFIVIACTARGGTK
jgi:hypothetical protein